MIVKFFDDEVLLCVKFVTNFTNVYIRIQQYPISLNNISINADIIFKKIKDIESVELLWECEDNISKYNFDWNKRIVDVNFYDNIPLRWEEINKNKYLYKRKLKRFLDDDDFKLIKCDVNDIHLVKDCYDEWVSFKGNKLHNKKLFNKIFKDFNYIINHTDIEVLLFKYKNIVLGCSIFVKMGTSYQTITEFSRTIRSYKGILEDKIKTFLQGSAQIMNYYHIKYFLNKNINILTYSGSMERDGLYYHKLNNYGNKIEYYSTKL